MSYLQDPRVRKNKFNKRRINKDFAYTSLGAFMDLPDFASIRDYFIRSFIGDYAIETWKLQVGETAASQRVPGQTYLYGVTSAQTPEDAFSEFVRECTFGAGPDKTVTKEVKNAFKAETYDRFIQVYGSNQPPYEKVGTLMRMLLDAAKSFPSTDLRISHVRMRRWMTKQLGVLTCDALMQSPSQAAWPRKPAVVMATITSTLDRKTPDAPLPIAFPNRFKSLRAERSSQLRDTDKDTIVYYRHYPKNADTYRSEAAVRDSVLKELSTGEHLITLPWMENGFQLNAFSWRNFDIFLYKFYMMTCTEKTFDKGFFCEWVAYGGAKWSTPQLKEKYESLWDEAYNEWLKIAQSVIPSDPKYAVPQRMTSLPKSLQRSLAQTSVTRWPGLVASPETLALLDKNAMSDVAFEDRLQVSKNIVGIRDSLGFMHTTNPEHAKYKEKMDTTGAVAWSIHEHLAIEHALRRQPSTVVSMPDTLADITEDLAQR